MLRRPQKRRYVFNSAFGILAAKLDGGINSKQQQYTDQEYGDDIEHHRPRMPFTVLVWRLSSAIICSGVSAESTFLGAYDGSPFRNVTSHITTPIMYVKGVAIRTIALRFVPNSERSRNATSDPAAAIPNPKTMPKACCCHRM